MIHIIIQPNCQQNSFFLVINIVNRRKFHYLQKPLHLSYLVISSLYFPIVHSIFFHFKKKFEKLILESRLQGLSHYHQSSVCEIICLKQTLFQLSIYLIHVDSKYYSSQYQVFNHQMTTLQSFPELFYLNMKFHALKLQIQYFQDFVNLSLMNLILPFYIDFIIVSFKLKVHQVFPINQVEHFQLMKYTLSLIFSI